MIGVSLAASACSSDSGGSAASTTSATLGSLVNTTDAPAGSLDSLTWNIVREPISLDPMTAQTEAEGPVVGNLCEGLVRTEPDLSITPALAESYEQVSPTKLSFTLRDGVTFWNGDPLTADDVVASLERSFTAATSYWGGYFASVDTVRAIDDTTVEIDLKQPDALLLEELATAGGMISSAKAIDEGGDTYGSADTGVMCTGPYELDAWTRGKSLTITRNDGYWGDAPKVAKVTFSWISDETSLTRALQSGEIDGTFAVPYSGVSALRKSGAGDLTLGNSSQQLMLIPTEKRGLLADATVRRAIFLATDRSSIVDSVLAGAALPGAEFVAPYWSAGRDEFAAAYAEASTDSDIAEAKKLIGEAGADGATITVATPAGDSYTRVANAMAQMLEQVGVTMKVEVLTSSENEALFFDKALREKYDGFMSLPFTNVADPLEQMLYVTEGHVYNYGLYENDAFETAFSQALTATDADEQVDLTLAAQKIVNQELPWIPIAVEPVRLWQKKGITGAPASFSYLYNDWAARIGSDG